MQTVLVTGASGYIASYIVRDLLAKGYRVRGTVRNPDKMEELAHLRSMPGAPERLELVRADLLEAGAFDSHVRGCSYVVHTASPYALEAKDPDRDLVQPAREGTRNVLRACLACPDVRRVVLTSSMAAITDEPESDHVLTEADWNTKSSLERNPYYYSKTIAEREAWRMMDEEKPAFDLVVINPFLVVGPSLTKAINPSNQVIVDLYAGTYPGIMNITWGFVDVRDVATAHILAMESPKAKGRYVCANTTMSMRELVEVLKSFERKGKLPNLGMDCGIGDFAVKLMSYTQPKGVGTYLRTHVGRVPRFDHGKIQADLGMVFTPLAATIKDTVDDLARWNHLPG